jgi:outer membrane protease
MNSECAEFNLLYPSISISSLPDSIWESVKKGVPIAAAYALEERRAAVADMKAQSVNAANRQLSSGSIDAPATEEFYTPDEVRAMSPLQVRENYSKIISSMSKWH